MGHKTRRTYKTAPERALLNERVAPRATARTKKIRGTAALLDRRMGDVGLNIAAVIRALGMDQRSMAPLLGVDPAVLSRSIHGRREFRASELYMAAVIFRASLDALFLPTPEDAVLAVRTARALHRERARAARTAPEDATRAENGRSELRQKRARVTASELAQP